MDSSTLLPPGKKVLVGAVRRRRRHELSGAYLVPMVSMHDHAPGMPPGRRWVIRCDVILVAFRFPGPVSTCVSRIGAVDGVRGTPLRESLEALSFAGRSLWHRACFKDALWSFG